MNLGKLLGCALIGLLLGGAVLHAREVKPSAKWKALRCPAPALAPTWGIADRDGANRKVEPYLSSLVRGESSTGMITSPPFFIETDAITFTICGHDGEKGGRNKNFIALVDARKGEILMRTPAPGNDAMQERRWDVRKHKGKQVRVELHDGTAEAAFAWFGVGRIEAGPAIKVIFRNGMPKDWAEPQRSAEIRYEKLTEGVPFNRIANVYTLIPRNGEVTIPCGFAADRLFFLGGTVAGGKPLQTYGSIELHYRTGKPEVFPLMCGFNLDAGGKLLSPSKALRLHPSADPYQAYLVLKPRREVIEKIRLVANPGGALPRITGITCKTDATAETLMPLLDPKLTSRESAWIEQHTLSGETLDLNAAMQRIREAHKLRADK